LDRAISAPRVFHAGTYQGAVEARLSVEPLPEGATLEEYARATADAVATSAADLHPVKLSQESLTIRGLPAVRMTFACGKGPNVVDVRVCMILLAKNRKGYVLTCTATERTYSAFLPAFTMIGESIELLD
jgi:hypothetical protein